MIKYNPVTKESGDCIVVGRAATAIYLILSELKEKGKYVIVPANICYAAVFPILSAGLKPLFCDIDKYSGNITLESIKRGLKTDVIAAIIPHMYGNPVQDIELIQKELEKSNVILIEDCASLMSNIESTVMPGTVGDYVIYSTGYSKTIDLGFGGLLFSKRFSLVSIESHEVRLPLFDKKFEQETALFSKIYRILRNQRYQSKLESDFYSCLMHSFKENFIYRIDEEKKIYILNEIKAIDKILSQRKTQFNHYYERLANKYHLYKYEDNAVPWRFNLFIGNDRDAFVEYCLKNSLPVSDWYPCVTPIFGDFSIYENALWHEQHIINFPLMISDDEIDEICDVLLKYNGDV